ncbi:DUF6728 family protein [Rhizosphaericola mali]|uniref:DUF6728 family protein n=1 Tax=Rhizosphaericola mali TaxID=2545455 RepID=UPI00178432CB|nr:DUF6728 family protein [Rhizosphaericola mali]
MQNGFWNQIAEYLFLKKKDPNKVYSKNTKIMHGMNKISLFMFLIALLIIIFKAIFKHH